MRRNPWIIFSFILLLAFLSNALWLYEIVAIKSWDGLNWLSGYMYSPYIITLLISISAVIPFYYYKEFTFSKSCYFTVFIWISNFMSFVFFDSFLKTTHSRTAFFLWGDVEAKIHVFSMGVLSIVLSCFTLSILFRELNKKYSVRAFLYGLINPVIILSLSLVFVTMFVWRGASDDYIHAIKMGYPTFWLVITYGGLSIFFNHKALKNA